MRVKPRSPKGEVASRYAGFRRRLAVAHQRDATAVRPWSFTEKGEVIVRGSRIWQFFLALQAAMYNHPTFS